LNLIQVLPTELGKDDQKHLKVEMIQLKDVKNFKPTYIMDVESKITIKPVDVDTGDAKNKLSTTLKPLALADAPGVTQNDWSITWVDVVLTVLPLVCELYVVVSIHYWVSFTHITKFLTMSVVVSFPSNCIFFLNVSY
jgi:hypothetical protein